MLIRKKIIILLVIVFLLIATKSYGVEAGTIIGDNVRLRKEPNLQGAFIKLLSINDKVEVLGQEGDWYKITAKGDTGYIFKDYLKVKKQDNTVDNQNTNNITYNTDTNTVPIDSNVQNNSGTTGTNTNVVNNTDVANSNADTNQINVQIPTEGIVEETAILILPIINSSNIGRINANTKVTITEYKNGWIYILSEVANGWIREEKLKINNSEQGNVEQVPSEEEENNQNMVQPNEEKQNTENQSTNETSNKTQENANNTSNESNTNTSSNTTTTSSNVSTSTVGYATTSVNVRRGATTDSEIIDGLVQNDKVSILGEENGWYKVKVNGITGYIAKKYVSNEKVSTTTSRTSSIDRNNKENTASNGKDIVDYANQFLGCKYVLGGTNPSTGMDCSGFTYYVYKNFGYNINRTSSSQANNGIEISKSELQLGDLVFFSQGTKKIGHVGIYIGNNKFIHAANESKGVVITELSNSYYKKNYVTSRRIIK